METTRKCPRCERRTDPACYLCEGKGELPTPDFPAILHAVTTKRGAKGTRRFRRSAPEQWKKTNRGLANRRAYYVWRMARFHGGADVTMPWTAQVFCGEDPFVKELDAFASELAKKVFGTDLAGAHRWMEAMIGPGERIEGLPPTAYSGGPIKRES